MKNNTIITFITDNKYTIPTTVAISSIVLNKKQNSKYTIYIITYELSSDNKNILIDLVNKYKEININIIEYDTKLEFNNIKINSYVSKTALIKFYIADILNKHDKILYLDCDVIVLNDLTEFFNIELENNYAAVVKEYNVMEIMQHHKKINVKEYFNSGVMLLNTKKIRNENIGDKLVYYKKHIFNSFMDQDTFNSVFNQEVKFIHPKYNWLVNVMDYYEKNVLENFFKYDLSENIIIMHMAGEKPWDDNIAYKNFFDYYWYYYQFTYAYEKDKSYYTIKISNQKVKLLENNLLNYINNLENKISDLENKISTLNNQVNSIKTEIHTEIKNNINWIKSFGIYNDKNYIHIYFLFIKLSIKIDTNDKINKLVWWIPNKKLRDKIRNKLLKY